MINNKVKLRSKELILIVIMITILSLLKIINFINKTYAYYEDKNSVSILSSKVGDFGSLGEANSPSVYQKADINIILYTQDPIDEKKYHIAEVLPTFNYVLNVEKSNCTTGANYEIEENGTIKFSATEDTPEQVFCKLFYDRSEKFADIVIYALKKDENGNMKYNNEKYRVINEMPNEGYITHNCENPNSSLKYDSSRKIFTIEGTPGPNVCYVYFN